MRSTEADSPRSIQSLAAAIERIEQRSPQASRPALRGWEPHAGGHAPPGLSFGAVHEWLAHGPSDPARGGVWFAPLSVVLHLARCVVRQSSRRLIVWIGRHSRPYAPAMVAAERLLPGRSLFLDPPGRDERVWAIDTALRSVAVAAVVADAGGLRMADSRRFQLAASVGGTLGLLVRPPWEVHELSAAKTRWMVTPEVSPDLGPRWTVELLRCKGVQTAPQDARRWTVRQNHETGDVSVVPDAPDQRAAPAGWTARRTA